MSENGKELQGSSPVPIVSAIRVGLKADGGIHIELMGQPLPDLVLAGMLAKAEFAIFQPKQSKIVVPQVQVGAIPPEMRA